MSDIKLFVGEDFYPLGGYEDFRRSFSTKKEAIQWTEENINKNDGMDKWAHIVKDDMIILRGVLSGYYGKSPDWKWTKFEKEK